MEIPSAAYLGGAHRRLAYLAAQGDDARMAEMQVTVYTRQGCPLCDEGVAMARSVFGGRNVALVDVDLDLELLEKYTNRVPVVEAISGAVVAEGIIGEASLRSSLADHESHG